MPKPEAGGRKAKAGGAKKRAAAKGAKGRGRQQLSAAELFDRAQEALAYDQFDEAKAMLRQAVEMEPGNLELLEALGALLAEVGPQEEAVEVLRRAAEASPDEGFEKYMYLAQLLEGEEGLQAAAKGVEVLEATAQQASGTGRDADAGELRAQLSSARCALAEMRLQAAGEAGPSEDVEALLRRAQEASPSSPEPLQALASLRYEQGRPEEALALLRQSMLLWFVPRQDSEEGDEDEAGGSGEAMDAEQDPGGDSDEELRVMRKPKTLSEEPGSDMSDEEAGSEEGSDDEDDEQPSFEFRFECAKLLLELEETTDAAVQVLEDLIAENDAVPEVWHLLGLAYYSGGHLDEAGEVTEHGVKLMRAQGVDGAEEVALSFADLQAAIAEARQGGAAQDGGEQ